MSNFKEYEICGAALDPGEKCDCGQKEDEEECLKIAL